MQSIKLTYPPYLSILKSFEKEDDSEEWNDFSQNVLWVWQPEIFDMLHLHLAWETARIFYLPLK